MSAGLLVGVGGLGGPVAPAPKRSGLHLAAYRFALPRDATTVAATPAACALGTFVDYPNDPDPTVGQSGVGASTPSHPATTIPGIEAAIPGRARA